jgi:hypothetical protein
MVLVLGELQPIQNFELIAEGFGFGTEGITTNADTHSSVVADGSTDPVRNMFYKVHRNSRFCLYYYNYA